MTTAAATPPSALTAHLEALEDALRAAVGVDEGGLAASGRYVMGWEDEEGRPATTGGKRIRPALCLLAAEALGGSAADAMPGAVAVELVHTSRSSTTRSRTATPSAITGPPSGGSWARRRPSTSATSS